MAKENEMSEVQLQHYREALARNNPGLTILNNRKAETKKEDKKETDRTK